MRGRATREPQPPSYAQPWAFHKFLEILLEIRYLLQIRISGNFRGNMHAPAETVSRIFQDTHVQSHFGGRCGVPPPQARKILPKTGPFLSKSTILCVSLGLPGSGAGADIEIFGPWTRIKFFWVPHMDGAENL